MEEIFSDTARLQGMLDFEAALARAEAKCGMVPAEAAEAIGAKCKAEFLDVGGLSSATALSLNPAIPLVKQLTALVAKGNKDAARFVHWGATSQDANDTGLVLQMRRAFEVIEKDLETLAASLAELARKFRSTTITGRTLLQHAMPTTFGAKAAGWLDAITRHRERVSETRKRVLVAQFGGAVGTLSALGEKGPAIAAALANELKLDEPTAPWHTQRDRVAEVACTLGLLAGTLGKIARDISLHAQTEIGEILEPSGEGRGGSSTMPHKRNPVTCGAVLATAVRVPGLVCTMLNAMVQEDERGLGNWHAEWETLPEIFRLAGGALHQMAKVVPHLEVDTARMRANLEATRGLIYAEGVTMAVARHMGKSEAHKLVETVSRRARESGRHLRDVVHEEPSITKLLNRAELDRLFLPENYLGAAEQFVDRVLVAAGFK